MDNSSAAEIISHESGAATATSDSAPVSNHSQELSSSTLSAQLFTGSFRSREIVKIQPRAGNMIVCAYACHARQRARKGQFYGRFTETLTRHLGMHEDIEVILGRVQKDLEEIDEPPCIEVVPAQAHRPQRFCLARCRSASSSSSVSVSQLWSNFSVQDDTCQCVLYSSLFLFLRTLTNVCVRARASCRLHSHGLLNKTSNQCMELPGLPKQYYYIISPREIRGINRTLLNACKSSL
jgi:hypothetical protein